MRELEQKRKERDEMFDRCKWHAGLAEKHSLSRDRSRSRYVALADEVRKLEREILSKPVRSVYDRKGFAIDIYSMGKGAPTGIVGGVGTKDVERSIDTIQRGTSAPDSCVAPGTKGVIPQNTRYPFRSLVLSLSFREAVRLLISPNRRSLHSRMFLQVAEEERVHVYHSRDLDVGEQTVGSQEPN